MTHPFNAKILAAVIVAGITAFVAYAFFSVYADELRTGRDGRGHALSTSAVGFQGLVRLIELAGGKAAVLRSPAASDRKELLVVVLEPQSSRDDLQEILNERSQGEAISPTLIILPKWHVAPDPTHPGWVMSAGAGATSAASDALGEFEISAPTPTRVRRRAIGTAELDGLQVPEPERAQTITGENVIPLLSVPGEGALLARVRGFYVLADPDLLNNQGLKDRKTAQSALLILERLNSADAASVAFDVTLNGFGRQPSVYKLAFEPPFLAFTGSLFVAALLAGLHGAFRFGPTRREERAIAFGKLALIENSAGLVQLARREHKMGTAYAELIKEGAAAASGAPPSLHGPALDTYLDRLSQTTDAKFRDLAAAVCTASDRHEMLRAARALFLWKKENIL